MEAAIIDAYSFGFYMTFKEYIGSAPALFRLIGINLLISVILLVAAAVGEFSGFDATLLSAFLTLPSSLGDFLRMPWTLLSYMFTQTSFLHLLFNMLWLLWFGRVFLYVSSGRRLAFAYLGGGIIGGIFYLISCNLLFHPAATRLIGSSAAVLSVMTASAIMAPNLEFRMLLIGGMRLKYVALLCILLTFFGVGGGQAGGQAARLGGVAFGALYALVMPRLKTNILSGCYEKLKNRASSMTFVSVKKQKSPSRINAEEAAHAMKGRLCDEQRLDQLLDKVRISGYDSLSESEKRELNAISKRL